MDLCRSTLCRLRESEYKGTPERDGIQSPCIR